MVPLWGPTGWRFIMQGTLVMATAAEDTPRRTCGYRETSLIRNSLPPSDHRRTLGPVLL